MFNIGGWELVFIVLLVLLLWKPDELESRARQLGRWWARLTHSSWWRGMQQMRWRVDQFLREAAREANLEEAHKAFAEAGQIWPAADAEQPRATRAFEPPPPTPRPGSEPAPASSARPAPPRADAAGAPTAPKHPTPASPAAPETPDTTP